MSGSYFKCDTFSYKKTAKRREAVIKGVSVQETNLDSGLSIKPLVGIRVALLHLLRSTDSDSSSDQHRMLVLCTWYHEASIQ